jgi:hypothetical protein
MAFKFKIEPDVYIEIQKNIDHYNSKQKGLGRKFWLEVNHYFKAIRKNPFYQVRYDSVRCLPLKKFPAMIHFSVDEKSKTIIVRAIINTFKDPQSSWL